tara:strand:- start:338 stop:526 length:189 start_codon:yes stop_codon:yes gene_type:complete
MTVFEALIAAVFFALGLVVACLSYIIPMRKLKKLVYKLKGQVYYWSRQIPVKKKPGRPRKNA